MPRQCLPVRILHTPAGCRDSVAHPHLRCGIRPSSAVGAIIQRDLAHATDLPHPAPRHQIRLHCSQIPSLCLRCTHLPPPMRVQPRIRCASALPLVGRILRSCVAAPPRQSVRSSAQTRGNGLVPPTGQPIHASIRQSHFPAAGVDDSRSLQSPTPATPGPGLAADRSHCPRVPRYPRAVAQARPPRHTARACRLGCCALAPVSSSAGANGGASRRAPAASSTPARTQRQRPSGQRMRSLAASSQTAWGGGPRVRLGLGAGRRRRARCRPACGHQRCTVRQLGRRWAGNCLRHWRWRRPAPQRGWSHVRRVAASCRRRRHLRCRGPPCR
jgi:hypothetical protein